MTDDFDRDLAMTLILSAAAATVIDNHCNGTHDGAKLAADIFRAASNAVMEHREPGDKSGPTAAEIEMFMLPVFKAHAAECEPCRP